MFCQFCKEISANTIVYKDIVIHNSILFSSKYFVVVPSLWSFVPWYVLIIPKRHIYSFASLTRDERDDFYELLSSCEIILKNIRWEYVIFEHWENGTSDWCSCVHHAHLHMIPHNQSVYSSNLEWENISEWEELVIYDLLQEPYLFIIQQWKKYVMKIPSYNCSQFFRKIIAQQKNLAHDKRNWRKFPFVEHIQETIIKLSLYRK